MTWRNALVVPCYNETPTTVAWLVESTPSDTAIVMVVNNTDSAPAEVKAVNLDIINASLGANVTVLDVSTPGRELTPPAHGASGAGMARALGALHALSLDVKSRWVHFTDADSTLPSDYFGAANAAWRSDSALYLRSFKMIADPGADEHERWAVDFWNLSTLMALVGRTRTHCPWPSQISTIGIDRELLRSGGYPSYAVCEDFMAVNLYGKRGRVHRVAGPPVRFSGRVGSRGPAGCGDHIGDWSAKHRAGVEPECYSPAVYAHTRALYDAIKLASERPDAGEREVLAAVCSVPGLFGVALDAKALRHAVLTTIGDLRCASWSTRCVNELDFAAIDGIMHDWGAYFPLAPLGDALKAFGWGDASTPLDVAISAARRSEAEWCFCDYGAFAREA